MVRGTVKLPYWEGPFQPLCDAVSRGDEVVGTDSVPCPASPSGRMLRSGVSSAAWERQRAARSEGRRTGLRDHADVCSAAFLLFVPSSQFSRFRSCGGIKQNGY